MLRFPAPRPMIRRNSKLVPEIWAEKRQEERERERERENTTPHSLSVGLRSFLINSRAARGSNSTRPCSTETIRIPSFVLRERHHKSLLFVYSCYVQQALLRDHTGRSVRVSRKHIAVAQPAGGPLTTPHSSDASLRSHLLLVAKTQFSPGGRNVTPSTVSRRLNGWRGGRTCGSALSVPAGVRPSRRGDKTGRYTTRSTRRVGK